MATGPSSCAVSAAADVWTSRSGEPSNSRRFPTSEIGGSRSDRRRSPKTEIPRLVSTSAYGRSETKPSSMRSLATTSRATAWMHACPGIEPQTDRTKRLIRRLLTRRGITVGPGFNSWRLHWSMCREDATPAPWFSVMRAGGGWERWRAGPGRGMTACCRWAGVRLGGRVRILG